MRYDSKGRKLKDESSFFEKGHGQDKSKYFKNKQETYNRGPGLQGQHTDASSGAAFMVSNNRHGAPDYATSPTTYLKHKAHMKRNLNQSALATYSTATDRGAGGIADTLEAARESLEKGGQKKP